MPSDDELTSAKCEVPMADTRSASGKEHDLNRSSPAPQNRCFKKRLWNAICTVKRVCFPLSSMEDEKTFLCYQIRLRDTDAHLLHEAMDVLDIIDCKTQSLLAYISLSFAALVFLLTGIRDDSSLELAFFGETTLIRIVLLFLIILSVAIILCLSCLNIVGAHTIMTLECQEDRKRQKEYENLIIKVTLARRTRYLIAHRISIVTAACLGLLFVFVFLGDFV